MFVYPQNHRDLQSDFRLKGNPASSKALKASSSMVDNLVASY